MKPAEAGEASREDPGWRGRMTSFTTLYVLPKPPVLRLEVSPPAGAVPDGRSAFEWPSGARYEGQWLGGKPHGTGAYSAPDGCTYDGHWLAGTPNGFGVLKSADGTLRYTGHLQGGVCEGVGTLVCDRSGVSFQGHWAGGKPDGRGRQSSIDLLGKARHTDGIWQGGICTCAHRVERGRANSEMYAAFMRHCVPRSHATFAISSPIKQRGDLSGPKKRRTPDVTPSSQQYDFNRDWCDVCGSSGNLICCDGCPAAFHLCCVYLEADEEPLGPWYCRECASRLWARPSVVQRRGEPLCVTTGETVAESEATPPMQSTPHGGMFIGGCLSPRKEPAPPVGPARYLHYWRDDDLRVFLRRTLNADAVDSMTRDELVKQMLEKGHLSRGVQSVQCSRVGPRYQASVPEGMPSLAVVDGRDGADGAVLEWSGHVFAERLAPDGVVKANAALLLAAVEANGRSCRVNVIGGNTVASSSAPGEVTHAAVTGHTADSAMDTDPSSGTGDHGTPKAAQDAKAPGAQPLGSSTEEALRLIHACGYNDAALGAALVGGSGTALSEHVPSHPSVRPWSQDEHAVRIWLGVRRHDDRFLLTYSCKFCSLAHPSCPFPLLSHFCSAFGSTAKTSSEYGASCGACAFGVQSSAAAKC